MHDRRCGIRLLRSNTMDNHSKLLKMELGQQFFINKNTHQIFAQDEKGCDEEGKEFQPYVSTQES